ncbi:MAG: J domain-containing protein [Armatimonadetes bacterium]|nr:J domain-containing protein [Armatimonadota bacterium]
MPPVRNYYEILGVAQGATQAEIKASYRRLVRKYHPDIHPDKRLAQRAMVQINEAYGVLSDPDRRSYYDVEQAAAKRAGSTPTSSISRPRPAPSAAPPPRSAPDRALRDAEFAFIRGRMGEAEAYCREALRLQRSSGRAYAILGDIYHARNLRDKAVEYYTYAVQFDPYNRDIQSKLNRLIGLEIRTAKKGRSAQASGIPKPAVFAANLAGWVSFCMMFAYWIAEIGPAGPAVSMATSGLLKGWNWQISLALCAEGLLLGALLRSGRFLGHYADELVFQSIRRGVTRAPIGLMLLALAAIFFWLALVVYLLMATFQENMSKSLVRGFFVTVIFLLVAGLFSPFHAAVLAIGGNFVFVALLTGWWMVDVFRDNWVRELDVR